MMIFLRGIAILVLALVASRASAADQAPPASDNAVTISPPVSAAPAVAAAHDPTVPNAELRSALDKSGRSTAGPGRAAVKAPEIVLRGRLQVAGQPVTALIEVGGKGLYAIVEGAKLTVDSGHGESLTLQVARLTLEDVEIEIVGLHQKVTVR